MTKRKIVLFGGTFDPIHLGHTAVAAVAAENIGAEKVFFIPAKHSPLKAFFPKVNDEDRAAMITLAITDYKNFQLSDYELKKPHPSYSLETVRKFQSDYGSETEIYWLIGADSVEDLPLWYKTDELIDECNVSVMYRAGCKLPDFTQFTAIWGPARVEKLQRNIIQTPLIDISSTKIRERLAAGLEVTEMLHPLVIEHIRQHGLYR